MKRLYSIILIIILAAFVSGCCCGQPKESLKTVQNAGFVKIVADPDSADVYVDGVLTGTAREFDGRTQILQLKAGRHKIELKKEGYFPYSREMMVGAGSQEEFKVKLSKE